MTLFEYDRSIETQLLCGVDEAGRGPLAGPVVAAAVILPKKFYLEGLNDSKKISEKKRELLFPIIKEQAVAYSIGSASVEEIDSYNILQATFLAMKRAIDGLEVRPSLVLIDGNKNPNLGVPSRCVVKGDATSASIAAASVLAKVTRDHWMMELDQQYPEYQFAKHKGYGTKLHIQLIVEYGISPVHRRSFTKKLEASVPGISLRHGELGEKLAYSYLKQHGCQVIARNYRSDYGEIDLIALDGQDICFVEVKLRDRTCGYRPKEAVTPSKQAKIAKTAALFLQNHPTYLQPRFDVVEIMMQDEENVTFHHLKHAFYPEGDYGLL